MPWKFNPFSGTLDQTGSGGGGASYIDGEVQYFSDLPQTIGSPAVDSAYLVREAEGAWLLARKPAGIYIRTADSGVRADDWTHASAFPDVFNDANFLLYDNGDATKNLQFQLSGITTGTTRTLTVPNASGVIGIAATRSVVTYSSDQTLPSTRHTWLVVNNTNASGIFLDLPNTNTNDGDIYTISGATLAGPLTIRNLVNSTFNIYTTLGVITQFGHNLTFRATGNGLANWEVDGATWPSPPPIGNTTPNTGAFTTLTANNGTLTASAPVLNLAQTWNDSGVTFTGLRFNATDTASATNSLLLQLQTGGTDRFSVNKAGRVSAVSLGRDYNSQWLVFNTAFTSAAQMGGVWFFQNAMAFGAPGALGGNYGVIQLGADQNMSWSSSNTAVAAAADLRLFRDGANTLAQRNGSAAQTFRLYGTFTSSTNYQRMTVRSVKQTLSALSGASATTTGTLIPDGAVVVGVTTRVATAITGATGYTIGDGTDADRWGDITGTAVGTTSDNRDWTAGTIECFTAGGEVTLTANTNNFTAGAVEICVFYLAGEAD